IAEEAAQEAAVAIWRHWDDGFNPRLGSRTTWAATIARHKAIDRFRGTQRRAVASGKLISRVEDEEQSGSGAVDIEQLVLQRDDVRRAWSLLSPNEQALVILLAQGYTLAEAATRLSWPLGT